MDREVTCEPAHESVIRPCRPDFWDWVRAGKSHAIVANEAPISPAELVLPDETVNGDDGDPDPPNEAAPHGGKRIDHCGELRHVMLGNHQQVEVRPAGDRLARGHTAVHMDAQHSTRVGQHLR